MPAPRMHVGATLGRDSANAWQTSTPLLSARAEAELATADSGEIYAFGGYTGSGYLRLVEAYDPSSRTWSSRTPMPSARRGHAVVAAPDGLMYILGGVGEGAGANWLASVDVYNPLTDTWSTAASMPAARAFFGAVPGSDGRIYVIGGYNDTGYLSVVEAYNPSTNAWSAVAPLKIARAGLAVASVGNRLLAIGGDEVNGPNGFFRMQPKSAAVRVDKRVDPSPSGHCQAEVSRSHPDIEDTTRPNSFHLGADRQQGNPGLVPPPLLGPPSPVNSIAPTQVTMPRTLMTSAGWTGPSLGWQHLTADRAKAAFD